MSGTDERQVLVNGVKFFSVKTLTALLEPSFEVEHFECYGRFAGSRKNMIAIARKLDA